MFAYKMEDICQIIYDIQSRKKNSKTFAAKEISVNLVLVQYGKTETT